MTKTISKTDVKVPRLPKGQGFAGAEWYGCFNTGRRATIIHSRNLDVYVVGGEQDVQRALNLPVAYKQIIAGKRVIRWSEAGNGRRNGIKVKIHAFKGRTAAVAKFHELNQEVIDWNVLERERARKFNEAVRKGDLKGALENAD